MPHDKARIAALEADVKVLTEALHSLPGWTVKAVTLRQIQTSPVSVILTGPDETREILTRLN